MRYLLASAGVTNPSIHQALLDLLGKPIAECSALCIPTASYAQPWGPGSAWNFISGNEPQTPMVELGWKSVGVLELTALPSIDREMWVTWVRETDVLLVSGGDPLYLHYWMRESGLAEILPEFEGVYLSFSAGSMVMTPRIGQFFVNWTPPTGDDDTTLGLVDFAIYPHLEHPALPHNTMANAEKWAADIAIPAYAMDDATAIKVTDEGIEVISEGQWRHFPR